MGLDITERANGMFSSTIGFGIFYYKGTKDRFYSTFSVSHGSVTVRQHSKLQDAKTEAAKCDPACQ